MKAFRIEDTIVIASNYANAEKLYLVKYGWYRSIKEISHISDYVLVEGIDSAERKNEP